ncbi:autotransporter-associated beta strand repeat-containing protein [Dyella sp. 20L07]|uniref:autotransporter-associated beta strand repeat-containing protein n=1 Tax=Dyella sp. 20L07 TaxID=3384240 RepID=UPI003D299C0B
MNKLYSRVWSTVHAQWVVASELCRGRTKSNSSSPSHTKTTLYRAALTPLAAALLLLTGHAATAQEIFCTSGTCNHTVQSANPDTSSGYEFGTQNQSTINLSGALLGTIAPGSYSIAESSTIQGLYQQGFLTFTGSVDGTNYLQYYSLVSPQQNGSLSILDPVSNANVTFRTFNSSDISSGSYYPVFGSQAQQIYAESDVHVYQNVGLAEVQNSGGTLNVNIGDGSPTERAVGNTLTMYAKNTILTLADGTAGRTSTVNWDSLNTINFGAVPTVPAQTQLGSAYVTQFAGAITQTGYTSQTVTNSDGSTSTIIVSAAITNTVNSPSDLATYNSWLQGQLQYWMTPTANGGGGMTPTQAQAAYNSYMAAAVPSITANWEYNIWSDGQSHNNALTAPTGNVNVIYATGALATGHIAVGGGLAVSGSSSGIMRADQGATLINDGLLNGWSPGGPTSYDMYLTNATARNSTTGVINSGLFLDTDSTTAGRQNVNSYGSYGIYATGASTVTNDGIINQALPTSGGSTVSGITVAGTSQGTNSSTGVINLVDGRSGANSVGNTSGYAVQVLGNANFENDGLIYIGRGAQSTANQTVADVNMSGGTSLTAGIFVGSTGTITNTGTITIGTLARNAAAIDAVNSAGNVTNNGTITLLAGNNNGVLTDYGLLAQDSTGTIVNNGLITVHGVNNVGIRAYSTGATNTTVSTTASGVINVTGGTDPASGTRSYGVQVEGGGTGVATANVDSAIQLGGQGAIGVYVRDNAVANVGVDGAPVFGNTDQIGYYLFGSGATANVGKAQMSDSGFARTTLFRVNDGATFDGTSGSSGTALDLTINGAGSIGVLGSGAGASVSTDTASFSVGGQGAAAVEIQGGATGDISANTAITLTQPNTTAAIVDGQKYDLSGKPQNAPVATVLTSTANITSNLGGVVGYIARNKGTLTLTTGAIVNLSGSDNIGVDVQAGGILSNNGTITINDQSGALNSTSVGVRASGASSNIQRLGSVLVTNGLAGVQLINGASLSLSGSSGDTITTNGTANGILLGNANGSSAPTSLNANGVTITALGTGAGIQNAAEIGNVTLANVTINTGDGAAIRTATSFKTTNSAPNTLNISGSGTGFAFESLSGGQVTSSLSIGPSYVINVLNGATGTGISANTTGAVSTSGKINVLGATGGSAVVAQNASSISNTGVIVSASTAGVPVIDGSGSNGKTINNSGTVQAASSTTVAIQSGSGNNTVNLTAGAVTGVVDTGTGTDTFNWTGGTLSGEVNMDGTSGGNTALVGNVNLGGTRHILTGAGAGNTITFSGTTGANARVGSLGPDASSDNLTLGTNIGNNWSALTASNSANLRIVGNLQLAGTGSLINVTSNAFLRVGGNGAGNPLGSIQNHDVATASNGTLVFDNIDSQTYTGVISGTGNFLRDATGTTIFTSDNTYTGTTTINATGTLQLGTGAGTGSIAPGSNITDNGALIVDRNNAVLLNGIVSGSGTLTQQGTGTTTLTGANSYTGVTNVTNGTLMINGNQSAATGATSVSSGATLAGIGTVGGNVTIANGGTLSPGDAPGTLTINGNLVLNPTSISAFQFGQAYTVGGNLNDLVNVGGNLTLDGTLNVNEPSGGTFAPGVYRVFNYAGSLTNNVLQIGTLPPGTDASTVLVQTAIANQVNLVNGTGVNLQFWDGPDINGNHGTTGINGNGKVDGGTGVWQGAAGNNNWTTPNGVGNAPWAQGSFAIFQGSPGTVTVDGVTHGPVTFSGAQFAVDGYTVTGDTLHATTATTVIRVGAGGSGATDTATINSVIADDTVAGGTTLQKIDPGTLILGGVNTYRGGTDIEDGTLQISADDNLGASGTGVSINGATLKFGANLSTPRTITLGAGGGTIDPNGFTGAVDGTITGAGTLTVTSTTLGPGVVNLNGVNAYTGGTDIIGTGVGNAASQSVTVNANTTGALGQDGTTVSVSNDGTLAFVNAGTSSQTLALNTNNGAIQYLAGTNAGSSAISNTGANGLVSFQGNANASNATITNNTGATVTFADQSDAGSSTTTNSGTVLFSGTATAANAVVANQAGATVDISGTSSGTSVGSLSGAGNVALGAQMLSEGNLNRDDTISGVISGAGGGLTKIGSGTLTLTNSNSYTGATNVNAGTLLVNGNQAAATGAVTVATGATLGGAGIIGGPVSIKDGGTLAPGASIGAIGVLTTGSLTLSQNSNLDFQLGQAFTPGGPLNDLVNVNGDVILGGQLNITQSPGGNFLVGVYRLINYTGTLTDNILSIGSAPTAANSLFVQTSIANQVNLVNATGLTLNYWDGAPASNKNNGVVDGGNGVWQSSAGNDNWTEASGSINAPFADNAFAIFEGMAGNVTVDNSLGNVLFSGAQFATHGYVIGGEALTTNTTDTIIRVGDGTSAGAGYTATINSVIAGSGGLDKVDLGTLILAGANTYSGGTTVAGGTLQVSADNNLGASGTSLTLNGGTLQYGAGFASSRGVILGGNGGTIDTFGNDAELSSPITGNGSLTKIGQGTLLLTGDSTYAGGTTISAGTLQLGNAGTSGWINGDVVNNSVLLFDRTDANTLAGVISGTGIVIQNGSGSVTLTGDNSYSAGTLLNAGTLVVGNNHALGTGMLAMAAGTTLDFNGNYAIGNLIALTGDPTIHVGSGLVDLIAGDIVDGSSPGTLDKTGAGTLLLGGENTYSGPTNVTQGTVESVIANTFSAASAHTVDAGATLATAGFNQTVASLTNAGTVSLLSNTAGSNIHVTGNYVGQGGQLLLGVNFAQGVADELVIDGANSTASGTTSIVVAPLAGLGVPTTGNGIEVVSALNGATTTVQTSKSAFNLAGNVLFGGAYQYKLYAGDLTGDGENWYLRSSPNTTLTVDTALSSLAQQMTRLGTLHERIGDNQGPDSQDRGWVRTYGRTGDYNGGDFYSGGSTYGFNIGGIQAGIDLYNDMSKVGSGSNNTGNQAGVYISSVNGNGRVNGIDTTTQAGSISGKVYSLGGYWTHYFTNGAYLDAVIQGSKYRDMEGNAYGAGPFDTSGDGYAASLEVGYPIVFSDKLSLEPEAQLEGSYVSLNSGHDDYTAITLHSGTQWIGRVGSRLVYNVDERSTLAGNADVLHAFGDSTQSTFANLDGSNPFETRANPRTTWGQLGVAYTRQATQKLSVYLGMNVEFPMDGGRGQRSIGAQAGLKYSW